jgi:MoxR-like ATPase
LVESVPGLAKTTAINTLAKTLGIDFNRVQFTPDLLPSDLTGAQIYNPKTGEFSIKQGPILQAYYSLMKSTAPLPKCNQHCLKLWQKSK